MIHDKTTMMYMFKELYVEIPEFKDLLTYEFQQKKSNYVVKSCTKTIPLQELVRELFTPEDRDKKDSTAMLEIVGANAIQAMIVELDDPTKTKYNTYLFPVLNIHGNFVLIM